jgi:hypothetical protein
MGIHLDTSPKSKRNAIIFVLVLVLYIAGRYVIKEWNSGRYDPEYIKAQEVQKQIIDRQMKEQDEQLREDMKEVQDKLKEGLKDGQ